MFRYSLKVKPGLREESRYFRGSRSSSGSGGGGSSGGGCGSADNKTKLKRAKLQYRFSHSTNDPICRRRRRGWGKKEKRSFKTGNLKPLSFPMRKHRGEVHCPPGRSASVRFCFFSFFPPSSFLRRSEFVAYTRSQAVRGMHLNSRALTMRGTALLRPVASPLTFDMRDQDLSCRLQLIAAGMNSKRTDRSFVGPFLISQLTFFLFLLGLQ